MIECPFCEPEESTIVMVDSIRLGRQRPYCTGCGSPVEEEE